MELEQRFYSSRNLFRPKPLVRSFKEPDAIVLATSWGRPELAEQVADNLMSSFLQPASEQTVLTRTPGTELSLTERLQLSLKQTHEHLLQQENNKDFQSLVEVTVLLAEQSVIHFVRSGSPAIFVAEAGRMEAVASSFPGTQFLKNDPLPWEGLGTSTHFNFQSGKFRRTATSKIFLLAAASSGSLNPELDLEANARLLAKTQAAFWLAQLL